MGSKAFFDFAKVMPNMSYIPNLQRCIGEEKFNNAAMI